MSVGALDVIEKVQRMNWYCIYTKPNYEDSVCKKLGELPGIEVFNPKLRRKKYVRKRLLDVVEELFPCYIFSKLDLSTYLHLVSYTRGVKRFVGDRHGAPFIVDHGIIESITSRMTDGVIRFDQPKLGLGDKVVIKDGPFSGLTGCCLSELKPNERVIILLDAITLQARIELPLACVSKS